MMANNFHIRGNQLLDWPLSWQADKQTWIPTGIPGDDHDNQKCWKFGTMNQNHRTDVTSKAMPQKQWGWNHDHPSQLINRHRSINFHKWACRGCIHQWMAVKRAAHQPSRLWAIKPSQCNNTRTATRSDSICLQRTQTSCNRLRTNGEPTVTVPLLKIDAYISKKWLDW